MDQGVEELLELVERIMTEMGDKRSMTKEMYLNRMIARLPQDHCPIRMDGTFGTSKHAWIMCNDDEYIIDPYAGDYHFCVMASTRMLMDSSDPMIHGLCIVDRTTMPLYNGRRSMSSAMPPPVAPPVPPAPLQSVQGIPVWRLGSIGEAIRECTDAKHTAYPRSVTDHRGITYKYRTEHDRGTKAALVGDDSSVSAVVIRGRGTLHNDDLEHVLVHVLQDVTRGSRVMECMFMCAVNTLLRAPELTRIAFTMAKTEYPFRCHDLDYQSKEIADHCLDAPFRDLATGCCDRLRLRLSAKDKYLYVVRRRKSELEAVDLGSLADVNDAAYMIKEYLTNPSAPELRIVIPTGALHCDVVSKGKSMCIGARHMSDAALDLKTVIGDMIQYGQAMVGGFEEDYCTLTVHPDLRHFIGMQRARAVRTLQQAIANGSLGNRSVPSILLSKGMFASGSMITQLSAHDTSWRTYHPRTYKKGDLAIDFDPVAVDELEPLVTVHKYALICSSDLTRMRIHPTLDGLLPKIMFEVALESGRTVYANAQVTESGNACIKVGEHDIVQEVYAYGGPGGRKVHLDFDSCTRDHIELCRSSVVVIFAMDDVFKACIQ